MQFKHLIAIAAVVTLTACNNGDTKKNDKAPDTHQTTITTDSNGTTYEKHNPNETGHEHHAH